MEKFAVIFASEKEARLALWAAASTNYAMAGQVHVSLRVRFRENDRDREVVPMPHGDINEVTDSSGGEFDLADAVFYFGDLE